MSKTFIAYDQIQPTIKVSAIGHSGTVSVVSSKNRITYAGTNTGKHLSFICPIVQGSIGGIAGESVLDAEIQGSFYAPNGSGVRQGAHCRVVNYSGSDYRGYFVREVTPGDPRVWEFGTYDTASDSTFVQLAIITPPGVSATWGSQEIIIKLSFNGPVFRIKVWLGGGSEPSWSVPANTAYVTSTTYTDPGAVGQTGWDVNASGFYIEGNHFYLALINQVAFAAAGSLADSTGTSSGTVFTATNVTLRSGEVALIGILNTKADTSTNATPSSVSCTNLTISSALVSSQVYNTVASPAYRLHIYSAKATADITNGSLAVTFPAAQTGCAIVVYKCSNALNSSSDGSSAFLHGSIAAGDVLNTGCPTITLSSFTNNTGVSATVAMYARAVALESLTTPSGWMTIVNNAQYTLPTASLSAMHIKSNHTLFMAERVDSGCTRTGGSPTITDSSITANDVGRRVSGSGIPANSSIVSVSVGTSFTMNNNASTGGTAAVTLASNFDGVANSRSALFAAEVEVDPWHLTEYPPAKNYVGAIPILS